MTDQAKERVIEKVRALLKRAERHANETDEQFQAREGEIANSLSLANKLLEQHGLDRILLEGEDSFKLDVAHIVMEKEKGRCLGLHWRTILATAVSQATYTKSLIFGERIGFIGSKEEIEIAREMYKWLVEEVMSLRKRYCARRFSSSSDPGYWDYSRDFVPACSARILQRIQAEIHQRESEKKAAEGQTGTALVLVTNARNDQYIEKTWGPTKKKNFRGSDHGTEGQFDGYMAGKHARLRPQKEIK